MQSRNADLCHNFNPWPLLIVLNSRPASCGLGAFMNLPKDWLRKPDWLDRASEPSELKAGDRTLLIAVVVCVLVTLGALAWGAGRLLL